MNPTRQPQHASMRTPRRSGLVAFAISFIALVAILPAASHFLFKSERERKISYHLRKLEEVRFDRIPPKDLREFLNWRRLRHAVVRAFQPASDPGDRDEKHRQALVQLGYLQKTNFTLLSTNLVRQLYPAVMAANLQDTNWSYYWKETNLFVTAATFDMTNWSKIISNLNGTVR